MLSSVIILVTMMAKKSVNDARRFRESLWIIFFMAEMNIAEHGKGRSNSG